MNNLKEILASDEVDILKHVLKLKVVDLRKELKSLGLSTSGIKVELVARLQAALMVRRDAAASLASACGSSSRKVEDYVREDTLPSSEVGIRENEDSGKNEEIDLSEDLDESFHSKDLEIDLKDEDLEKEDEHEHLEKKGVAKFQDAGISRAGGFNIVPTTVVYPENSGKSEEIDLSEDLDESFHSKDLEIDLRDEDLEKEDEHGHLDTKGVAKFQDAGILRAGGFNIVPITVVYPENSGKSEEIDPSEDLDESFHSKDLEIDLKDEDLEKEDEHGHLEKKGVAKFQDAGILPVGVFNIVPSIKRCLPEEEAETVKPMKKSNFPTPILDAKVVKAKEEKQEKRAQCFNIISSQEKLTAGNKDKKHVSESQQTVQKTENIAYPLEEKESAGVNKGDDDEEKKGKRAERFGK